MKGKIDYPFFKMIKRLLKNVRNQNKKIYICFVIYTIAATIYPLFSVVLPKLLIGELSLGNAANVENILAIILGYLLLTSIFGFIRTYMKDFAYPQITRLRIDYIRDTFDKIVSIDYKYMEDATFFEKNGKAMEATSSNNNGVEGVYHKLFETPSMLITTVIFVVFIGMLNIFILFGLILNIIVSMWISRRVHHYRYGKQEELTHAERRKRYYYTTTHDFAYGKDIRIYNFKDRILNNYSKEILGYINIHKMIANKEYALGFLGLITLLLSDLATYGILIYKTINGMSIADFSMYLAAIVSLSLLLKTLIENISFTINEGQYVHDFYEFMDKDLGEEGGARGAIKDDTLEIEFKNVSFKYPNTDRYIFKNLDFKINKGEKLAIVGINGAGKSTLIKLMTGLFDVTEGEILINDIPIKEFNKKELFSMFSVVFQDVNILAYTIGENVACTSNEIDKNRVMTALDKVGLGSKVKDFSKGLNQMMLKIIEEDGTEFSGGESQKLAIARALYKDANMVIMDEPTATLDALAEAEIYESFSELVKGKTAIYVSHRMSSSVFCDKILIIDEGKISDFDSHENLMEKKDSLYYKLFQSQAVNYQFN
ncbi:ABC transporter ATP-binding protein [Proteiniborus sp. MB09-C3]|uniref:ABC transporter ATP-binding protein n=1 Tax=Proteiniborus sp. MB09-C3 TaxID=3050072 RepID=UPI0025537BE0|nr:ABC transporter ATP-binding protein [Proteiniborus sp. MB09-C3]WIV13745.1 ABC transporter ATP-binding protein [Proteiniborus sp. MB09-C3]